MDEKNIAKNQDSLSVARRAAMILIEKKAIDVAMFDVKESSSVTERSKSNSFFILFLSDAVGICKHIF